MKLSEVLQGFLEVPEKIQCALKEVPQGLKGVIEFLKDFREPGLLGKLLEVFAEDSGFRRRLQS